MSDSVTPWTVLFQAHLSLGFPRQEYWSGLPFPSPGIFPTEGWNLHLLCWQVDPLPLSHLESPMLYVYSLSIGLGWSSGRKPTCNEPLEVFVLLTPCVIHGLGDREPASCTVNIGYMCVRARSAVSDPADCKLPGSSPWDFPARILQWVAISSSLESSRPRDRTHVSCVSCIGRWVLYHLLHLGSPGDILAETISSILNSN